MNERTIFRVLSKAMLLGGRPEPCYVCIHACIYVYIFCKARHDISNVIKSDAHGWYVQVLYVYMHARIYIYMHACVYIYIYMYVCMYIYSVKQRTITHVIKGYACS